MNELITIQNDGTPVIDSVTIAEGAQVTHQAVLKLIRGYVGDFESFGRVRFEIQPFETAGGMQKREIAYLNENQATLLFTFLKNSEVARHLKVRVVMAFSQCRKELAKSRASAPALPDYPTALRQLASSLEKQATLEQKIAEDAPKVEFAETVQASTGDMLIREAAKTLGYPVVHLFDWLRTHSWITTKNEPYSERVKQGVLRPRVSNYTHPEKGPSVSVTAHVTPKGLYRIYRELLKEGKINKIERLEQVA